MTAGTHTAAIIFADGNETDQYRLQSGDRPETPLRIRIRRADAPDEPETIRRATLIVRSRGEVVAERRLDVLGDDDVTEIEGVESGPLVSHDWEQRDTRLPTGHYRLEVRVRRADGRTETYPNEGRLFLTIRG